MFGWWKRNEELKQMNLSLVKALERKNNYIAKIEQDKKGLQEDVQSLIEQRDMYLKDYLEMKGKWESAEKHIEFLRNETILPLEEEVKRQNETIVKLQQAMVVNYDSFQKEIADLKEDISYRGMNERSMLNNEEIYKKEISDLKEQVKLLEGLKDTLYKQEKENQYLAKIIRSMLVDFNKIRELADDACEDCPTITEHKE